MNTTVAKQRTENDDLKKEMRLLRSFMIGLAGKDAEGEYKPSFVRHVLKAAGEKPDMSFKNKKQFLDSIS